MEWQETEIEAFYLCLGYVVRLSHQTFEYVNHHPSIHLTTPNEPSFPRNGNKNPTDR